MVAIQSCFFYWRHHLYKFVFSDLFEVVISDFVDFSFLFDIKGEQSGKKQNDGIEGRIHCIQFHVLELFAEELEKLRATMEELEEVVDWFDADCSIGKDSEEHQRGVSDSPVFACEAFDGRNESCRGVGIHFDL